MASPVVRVPQVSELAVGDTVVFTFQRGGHEEEGFVLRHAEGYSAFVNRCPHWNVDLDLGDGRFFDARLNRIYCKTHGALFHPESGVCEHGPCRGGSLELLRLRLEDGDALIEVPVSLRIF